MSASQTAGGTESLPSLGSLAAGILGRYLSRQFLFSVLGCLLGLSAIAQLLDLLDKTGDLLTRGGVGAIGRYILMRLPATIGEMIALATLIGALVTFTRFARSREMTILSAAGVSLRQVLAALLPACGLLAAMQFIFQTELAPRSERAVADWWARTTPPGEVADTSATLWMRVGRDVVSVAHVSLDGHEIEGVELLRRNAEGDFTDRVTAARGVWDRPAGGWVLHDVDIVVPTDAASGADPLHRDTMKWPGAPRPRNLVALARPVESQTIDRLVAASLGRWVSPHGPRYDATQIEALLVAVFDPLVMVLLAMPLLLVPPRTESGSVKLMRTLGLGLGYLAATGLLDALGNAGTLPGAVAALAAIVIFGGYGIVRLLAAEYG